MLGTLVNFGAVVVGSLAGLLLHSRLPKRLSEIAFQAIGLFTLFFGFSMALKTRHVLILVFSTVGGSIFGELVGIDSGLTRLGEWLKARLRLGSPRFSEGLVAAFLLFCMGSMTVLGAIEAGTGRTPTLYYTKSLLDGFAAVALSAALGVGVIFSAVPLLLYQGGLTLLARLLGTVLSEAMVAEMTAVGGLILIGLGVNILELRRLRVSNMLPALVLAALLARFFLR
uniref:DUF554 domain-containing protein n=1 Tax=candidate division WOR-3 bacterium TaxID=2052148 RepID=A0A7C4CEC8_UNCW3